MMQGIRLIACDLDGTLLDEAKRLPADFPELVKRLQALGVVFCPASGRQYHTIREQFAGISNGIPVIAENGSYVVLDGKELYSVCLDAASVHSILAATEELQRQVADFGIVLCGKHAAYIVRHDEAFVEQVTPYYLSLELVESFDAIDDEILKVAIYDFESSEHNVYPHMQQFSDSLQVVVSGSNWLDIMAAGVNKGTGLLALQNALAVSRSETAAFGDYLNDLEMLDGAEHSYAMANAHPQLLARAKHIAHANTENGVVRAIEAMLADL